MNMPQSSDSLSVAVSYKAEQGKINVKKIAIAILCVLIVLTGVAVYNAPRLLVYADKPVKSDAVILFVGIESSTRSKEAHLLFNEGYSRYLIVPSSQQVIAAVGVSPQRTVAINLAAAGGAGKYPGYYENTHREVLYAQKMMNSMGLKSAIMVSSPYHMRRIKMICEKTFGEQARYISYVPTSYEPGMTDFGHVDRAELKMVILEFAKICWFRFYSLFL